MTATPSIDVSGWLEEQLAQASPDLLRSMVATFVEALMSAEADAVCGAGYNERCPERTNSRNGYRSRDFDTRVGTIATRIPKLRTGSYFPTGCCSGAGGRSPLWSPWWPPRICWGCRLGGWRSWSSSSASPG